MVNNKPDGKASIVSQEFSKIDKKAASTVNKKNNDLLKAYNTASALLTGLDEIKSQQGSTFDYKVEEVENHLLITTTIPALKLEKTLIMEGYKTAASNDNAVTISVYANKRIRVDGDAKVKDWGGLKDLNPPISTKKLSSKRRSATRKALVFVTREAKKKGLVP